MCISERVSWLTLALGSMLNIPMLIYLSQKPEHEVIIPMILILGWQYALLMQIPDALAWRYPEEQYPGKIAFFLNVTQPLVLFILIFIALWKLKMSLWKLTPAIVALTLYTFMTIKDAVDIKDYNIQPNEKCKYLTYTWWSPKKYILYFISMILLIFALAPEWGYIGITLGMFIGSIIGSVIVAGYECNPGSLWCWSIAGSGACTFIYYWIKTYNANTVRLN